MSRTAIFIVLLSGITLAGALIGAHADVYRWTDKQGVVHYSDQWVPGAKRIMTTQSSLNGKGAGESSAATAAQAGARAGDQQIQQAANERAVQAKEAKLRAKRCKQAQSVYHHLIYARRLFTTDKSGVRHYMSDQQADAARVKAREVMNQLCGGGVSASP